MVGYILHIELRRTQMVNTYGVAMVRLKVLLR